MALSPAIQVSLIPPARPVMEDIRQVAVHEQRIADTMAGGQQGVPQPGTVPGEELAQAKELRTDLWISLGSCLAGIALGFVVVRRRAIADREHLANELDKIRREVRSAA